MASKLLIFSLILFAIIANCKTQNINVGEKKLEDVYSWKFVDYNWDTFTGDSYINNKTMYDRSKINLIDVDIHKGIF